jgi:hypothetical protein
VDDGSVEIVCPSCTASFQFAPPESLLENKGASLRFRCSNCDHRFEFTPDVVRPAMTAEVDDHILIRTRNHQRYMAFNWEEVYKLITDGYVKQEDKLAAYGEDWKLGSKFPQLLPFFHMVERGNNDDGTELEMALGEVSTKPTPEPEVERDPEPAIEISESNQETVIGDPFNFQEADSEDFGALDTHLDDDEELESLMDIKEPQEFEPLDLMIDEDPDKSGFLENELDADRKGPEASDIIQDSGPDNLWPDNNKEEGADNNLFVQPIVGDNSATVQPDENQPIVSAWGEDFGEEIDSNEDDYHTPMWESQMSESSIQLESENPEQPAWETIEVNEDFVDEYPQALQSIPTPPELETSSSDVEALKVSPQFSPPELDDGPDFPVDIEEKDFVDFEAYQKKLRRRTQIIVYAMVLLSFLIIIYSFRGFDSGPDMSFSGGKEDQQPEEFSDNNPDDTDTNLPEEQDESGNISGTPQNLQNEPNPDAEEGDEVTGETDNSNVSSKPGQQPQENGEPSTEEGEPNEPSDDSLSEDGVSGEENAEVEALAQVIEAPPQPEVFDLKTAERPRMIREGFLRIQQHRFDEAQQIFAYAISQDSTDPNVLHGLGWAYQEQGNSQEAVKHYCRLVGLNEAPADLKKECKARVKQLEGVCP